ncbi:Acyltransferase [Massilia sp. 9I]|nr:Acyltransferase [Massilia sp. 9I]
MNRPRSRHEAALTEMLGNNGTRLDYHVRRVSLEWFNFYDFWQLPDPELAHAAH